MNPEILNLVVGGDFSGASAALDALAGKFSSKLSKMAGASKAAASTISNNFSQIVGYIMMLQQPLSTKNMEAYTKRLNTLMKSVTPKAMKGENPLASFKDAANAGDPYKAYRLGYKATIDELEMSMLNLYKTNNKVITSFDPVAKSVGLYSEIARAFSPSNIASVEEFNAAMLQSATSIELAKVQAEGLSSIVTGMKSLRQERKGAEGITADLFQSTDFKRLRNEYNKLLRELPKMELGSPAGAEAISKVNNQLDEMIQKMTRVKALQESITREQMKGVSPEYNDAFKQSRYYTAFGDIQTSVGEQLKEKGADFDAIMQDAEARFAAATRQADELRNVLSKIYMEEQKRQIAKTTAKVSTEIELAANKELLSVAGVLLDKGNINYALHLRIQQAVETLKNAEQKINIEFDKEITKRKEILNTMIRQGQSAAVIAKYGESLNTIERQRQTELEKVSAGMLKIKQTMEATTGYFTMEREAGNLLQMSRNILTANRSTHAFREGMEKLSAATIRLGKVQNEFIRFFSRWRNRLLVLTFTFAGLIRNVQRFITLSAEADKQMASLAVVASNTGVSINKVTKAAEYLARDGVMSIEDAGQALKNLLSTGASLDIVTESLEAMKDAAMANGRASYTVGENIIAFTQGVKEEKSQLTDSAGVMTNLSNIVKKYSKEIKELGKANGILIGFTKEAMQFEGARGKVLDTLSGKMQVMKASVLIAKKALGELMQPIGKEMVSNVYSAVTQVEKYAKDNALQLKNYAVGVAKSIKDILGGIVTVGKVTLSAFSPIITGILVLGKGLAGISNSAFFKGLAVVIVHLKLISVLIPKVNLLWKVLKNTMFNISAAWGIITGKVVAYDIATQKAVTTTQRLGLVMKQLGLSKLLAAGLWAGVLIAVEMIVGRVIKWVQHQKELKLIDEERLKLSQGLLYNYEEMSKIQGVITKLKEKELKLGETATVKVYAEQLAKLQQMQKAVEMAKREASAMSSSGIGLGKPSVEKYKKMQKEFQSFQENVFNKIKPFYQEEFDQLEKWGYKVSDINSGMLQIVDTGGKIIKSIDLNYFKTWYELMSDINGRTSGIAQLSEELKGKTEKIVENVEKLRNEVDAISDNSAKQKILSFVREYRDSIAEAGKEQQDLNKYIMDSGKYYEDTIAIMSRTIQQAIELKQITQNISIEDMFKGISNLGFGDILAKRARKGSQPLSMFVGQENWEGLIAEVKYLGEMKQIVPEVEAQIIQFARSQIRLRETIDSTKESTKNWDDFLKLQHQKMILSVQKELESFIKSIKDVSDAMDDTLEQVDERMTGIRREGAELVAASTGSFYPKLATNIIDETQKITLEKVKAIQKIDREVKDLEEDLTGYRGGLAEYLKLFSSDKQAAAQEEYNKKLKVGEADLSALGARRLEIEQKYNDLLQERIKLLPLEVMLTARTATIEKERENALSVQQDYANFFRSINSRTYEMKASELEIEGKRLQLQKEINEVTSNTQYHFADLYTVMSKSGIPLGKWESSLKKIEEDSQKIFENLYLPGDTTLFEEASSKQKATVEKAAKDIADTYYNAFRKEMKRLIEEYNERYDKAEMLGVFGGAIGAEKYGFGRYSAALQEQYKLIKDAKEKGITLTEKQLNDTEVALNKAFWSDMTSITLAGTERVISTWANFALQKSQILREIEEDQIKNKTVLREQLKAGLIDQTSYDTQIVTLDRNSSAYRKAALLRKQADLWSGIQQTLATQAIEWAFLGAAELLIPGGNKAKGAGLLALAAAAGVTSPMAGAAATEYGKMAARAEGKYEFMSNNSAGTSVSGVSKASTYGSTIEGQPMSVTINPSISISGELIGIGADGVGELEEGLAPLMVVAIQNALDTGQINVSNIGVA